MLQIQVVNHYHTTNTLHTLRFDGLFMLNIIKFAGNKVNKTISKEFPTFSSNWQ